LENLISKDALIPVLIDIVEFLCKIKEAYYFEFEIGNSNIMVRENQNNIFSVSLINQLLPLHYRIEYIKDFYDIYDEEELEFNDILLVKKIIFLLITLSKKEGLEYYKEAKEELQLWNKKMLQFPSRPIQEELYKLALQLTFKIEAKEFVSLAMILNSLEKLNSTMSSKEKKTKIFNEKQAILEKKQISHEYDSPTIKHFQKSN
jgi:hypothetical protein